MSSEAARPRKPTAFEPNARLFRPGHAAQFLGLATTSFYKLRKQPGFPKPRLVGFSLVPMYSREDLEAWVRSLPVEPAAERRRIHTVETSDGSGADVIVERR